MCSQRTFFTSSTTIFNQCLSIAQFVQSISIVELLDLQSKLKDSVVQYAKAATYVIKNNFSIYIESALCTVDTDKNLSERN